MTEGVPESAAHIPVPPRLRGARSPGDIITHCATPNMTGLSGSAGVAESVLQAHQSGILFDLGHGAGGFAFDVLEEQLSAGIAPCTISTDLHWQSLLGPAYDLPTTMSKLLAAGMPLVQAVAAVTAHPAAILSRTSASGSLQVGSPANIAVFEVLEGRFDFRDTRGLPKMRLRRHRM